jgi:hypothetical protein
MDDEGNKEEETREKKIVSMRQTISIYARVQVQVYNENPEKKHIYVL